MKIAKLFYLKKKLTFKKKNCYILRIINYTPSPTPLKRGRSAQQERVNLDEITKNLNAFNIAVYGETMNIVDLTNTAM